MGLMDEEDGVSWARLVMELRTEDVPADYMKENRERVKEVLYSVVELNHFDGRDEVDYMTIMPGDSASQAGGSEALREGPQLRTSVTETHEKKHSGSWARVAHG
jgi:hypothetical protein